MWALLPGHAGASPERTVQAHRLVAIAFGLLTAALTFDGVRDLLAGQRPDESTGGSAYLAVTALVMFVLAITKRRVAERLASTPLHAKTSTMSLDGVLSTSTMLGLLLNAVVGWWWADPAAVLIVRTIASCLPIPHDEGNVLPRRIVFGGATPEQFEEAPSGATAAHPT